MNIIEEYLINNKFYNAFLEIEKQSKNSPTFFLFFFKYINILSSFQETPQLKAFLNMVRSISKKKINLGYNENIYNFFIFENLFDLRMTKKHVKNF